MSNKRDFDAMVASIEADMARRRARLGGSAADPTGMASVFAWQAAATAVMNAGSNSTHGRAAARVLQQYQPRGCALPASVSANAGFNTALAKYNAANGCAFEEREVRGSHRKPCDDCGEDFNFKGEYFVDQGVGGFGFGQDKLCLECMTSRVQPFMSVTPSGNPSSNRPTAAAAPRRIKDSERSTVGWQTWPTVTRGDWGLVYVVPEGRFGYYDDDEDGCLVYLGGGPLQGDCYEYKRSALRKPPFEGEFTPM